MSKSAGNFETARELLKKYPKEVLRFYLLSAHYRSPLDFSEEIMAAVKQGIDKIKTWLGYIELIIKQDHVVEEGGGFALGSFDEHIEKAMSDDLNTPAAISTFFSLINGSNAAIQNKKLSAEDAKKLKQWLLTKAEIFGIIPEPVEIPKEITDLANERESARKEGKWDDSDKIRAQIENLGYQIEDTVYGPLINSF